MKTLELTQGRVALLDDEDFERVKGYSWHAAESRPGYVYARRTVFGNKSRYLHHDVIGHPRGGFVVDHINGDTLDNRRENLRFVTVGENSRNKHTPSLSNSGIRCVDARKNGRFVAKVGCGAGQKIYLGSFGTAEEAEAAVASFNALSDSPPAIRREIEKLERQVVGLKARLAELQAMGRAAA